jgi:protein-disulfide isomerase
MSRRRTRALILCALTLASASCTTPNSLAGLQVQLNEAADAMNNLQQNLATLQASIDSMNVVLAKQDTTIQRLANAAGIPIAK